MTTYSTQFAALTLPANSLVPIYTVPSSDVIVLRDMELFIGLAGDLINVQLGSPGATTIVWYVSGAPASSWHQWQGRTVLRPNQQLFAYSGAGGAQLVVSGYLLSSP